MSIFSKRFFLFAVMFNKIVLLKNVGQAVEIHDSSRMTDVRIAAVNGIDQPRRVK